MSKIVLTTQDTQFVLDTDKIVGVKRVLGAIGCVVSFKGETGHITTTVVNEPFDFITEEMGAVRCFSCVSTPREIYASIRRAVCNGPVDGSGTACSTPDGFKPR